MLDVQNAERQIADALIHVYEDEYNELGKLPPIAFSKSFAQKMQQIIHAKPKKSLTVKVKRRIVALAAAILLIFATLFSVSATREPIVRFFINVYEKFSTVIWQDETPSDISEQPQQSIEKRYTPTWLPEGYALAPESTVEFLTQVSLVYNNSEGKEIYFSQFIAPPTGWLINTEGIQTHPVQIQGYKGHYYVQNGITFALWNDDKYGYTFNGPISVEAILRMAESVKLAE
jgi:hypothetical protein